MTTSPLGLHRVIEPPGVLPQAAWRLDASPAIAPDEVRIRVDRLNLDAASYRQLREAYSGDPDKIRQAVLDIITTRGKMQNPVTGSGGMLTGTVEESGPESPLGLEPGQRVATLVSLTLTPLAITDGLVRWDGQSEQVPCEGHAILFGRSIAAVLPDDMPTPLALAVMDVCGAPALTSRGGGQGAALARGSPGRRRQDNRCCPHGDRSPTAASPQRDEGRRRRGNPARRSAPPRGIFPGAAVPPCRGDSDRRRQRSGRIGEKRRSRRRTG